ncbi:UNVERIFIED_CONTAM: hypothetical protein FKN15_072909 [Acipenser sinensis]
MASLQSEKKRSADLHTFWTACVYLRRGSGSEAAEMGCGLPKLEKPDENGPGKIYSTLKRPQVETKVGTAYSYCFLDFTLGKDAVFLLLETHSEPDYSRDEETFALINIWADVSIQRSLDGSVHNKLLPVH